MTLQSLFDVTQIYKNRVCSDKAGAPFPLTHAVTSLPMFALPVAGLLVLKYFKISNQEVQTDCSNSVGVDKYLCVFRLKHVKWSKCIQQLKPET
jgi:hypothetical protein